MKTADKDYIISTVFRTNILPVISECNTNCIFCSHKQNPEGVEVFRMPKLKIEDFEEIIGFLSGEKKIVIGESATRIVEGEPLLHKDFFEVLKLVRKRYPKTHIQVTTNGILLSEKLIDKIVELGGIELNISINGFGYSKRKEILGLKQDDNITEKLNMLNGRVKYSGSFVWVDDILKEKDIEEIVSTLEKSGADAVRMFLPGYTYKSDSSRELKELYERSRTIIEELRNKYTIPIIIEPAFINDLKCKVEGVIKDMAAWNAGIRYGDIICDINGDKVYTRVEAFEKAFKLKDPIITVVRDNNIIKCRLEKPRNQSPGFILLYDMHPDTAYEIDKVVKSHGAKNVLFITSELSESILKQIFEIIKPQYEYKVISAANKYFGGNIKCAGLLTAADVIEKGSEFLSEGGQADLIMLPPAMFDFKRRDLTGKSIKEIQDILEVQVDTL